MSDNPLSGEVKLDVTNYKAGIAELNRQIRVIESGFRASASALGQWDQTAQGLEMRNKALNDSIGVQQKKVSALGQVYDELAGSGKASKKELEELQIKINKETETLGKMQSELKDTTTSLDKMGDESKQTGTQVKDLGDKEEQTREKSERLKSTMSGLWGVMKTGGAIVAGVAGAVAGMVVGVGKMITSSAAAADDIVELSAKTGISTQNLQEMSYIAEQTGTSLDTITSANAKVVRSMASAIKGGTDQAKVFDQLGVSLYNANGELKGSQDVFYESIEALGKITNETERDIASNALFGKSFQELNPLIKEGTEGLNQMRKEANENGIVMSESATEGLADFNDMLAGLKLGLKGTLGELSSALLPQLSGLGSTAGGYLKDLVSIIKGSNGDIGSMATGLGELIGKIVTDLAAQGPKLMEGGLGILKGLLGAIVSNLPVILPAVIQMIQAIVKFILESLPLLITAAVQIVTMLAKSIVEMLPMIIKAAVQIILALLKGLTQALPILLTTIMEIIPMIVQLLIDNLPMIITAGLEMVMALVNGLIGALPALIESIPTLVMAMFDAIVDNLPTILLAAVEIITTLAFGLIENIPLLLASIPEIISQLVDKFKSPEFKAELNSIGTELINGLKEGWQAAWDGFVASVTENWNGLLTKVKDLLGISSPSKLFMGIGQNMALGLGLGFTNEMDKVGRGINNLARSGFGMIPSMNGALGTLSSYSDHYAFYAPVIIQEQNGQTLGQSLKAKRY